VIDINHISSGTLPQHVAYQPHVLLQGSPTQRVDDDFSLEQVDFQFQPFSPWVLALWPQIQGPTIKEFDQI